MQVLSSLQLELLLHLQVGDIPLARIQENLLIFLGEILYTMTADIHTVLPHLPGDLTDLPVVHGAED